MTAYSPCRCRRSRVVRCSRLVVSNKYKYRAPGSQHSEYASVCVGAKLVNGRSPCCLYRPQNAMRFLLFDALLCWSFAARVCCRAVSGTAAATQKFDGHIAHGLCCAQLSDYAVTIDNINATRSHRRGRRPDRIKARSNLACVIVWLASYRA